MSDIIGNKGGSSSEHVHYEAPDSLHSTSFARVLDLVSEGEILGLSEGLQSVYLNDTPVQNADGTMNFKDVTIDFRLGTQTQDFIPGFPDVENEVSVNVELKSGTPWVRAFNNLALSAVRITLGVPALSQSDTKNGDIKGYKIDYKIELAKDGGAYSTVVTNSFNGKTTTAYQRSVRIDLPAASSGWQVRVTRLTANANTAAIADMTTVVSYTEVVDAKLRYPMAAIVGVQVDAKQFQNVPTRAYDLMGRIVQVPSNYNAKTRAYAGTWDGTFKPSWTDNPAWIFRDLALNDRYGLGHRITAAQLDKWSLYAIARYCDGLVPDGKGGMEPRFTCNVYLQKQKQAYAVLQDLASVFRGISYWGAGSIIASADMPTDPVYVYTAANVIGGKFARVGSSKKTRYTTAVVSWNDPADMYKAKVEYTEDPEGITRYGIQQVSLTAFGCTSQGQAQRVGRWALATSRLETEMISFDVGMDGAIALPGQIIRVADPARMGRRNGGRIKTASGRVVVLDKAPTISAGDKLTVILPTGTSETRTVSSIAGDAVTVSADWTTVPLAQSVWSVDSAVLMAPTYKVRSVTEKDATTFTISATQHEPGKFDFVELGTAITPRPETVLNVAVQQPPAAVTVMPYTVSLPDVQKLGFIASCAEVPGATAYEGAFQADYGNWFNLPRQPGPVFDVLDVLAANYVVKIAAVNSVGITSLATASASTLVSKNANPKNADILLSLSSPGFNVAADGSITPASITVHASLLDLEGTVSWSALGATISSSGNNAVIAAANMPGAAATITASITALGQVFTRSIDIVKGADGVAGAQSFAWIKYGTSATGAGLTDNPDGMTYIGLAFNKSIAAESTNPADYVWSLIKGSNGADGASTFTGVIYKQQVGAPATPSGGTFNFATTTLTPPSGWTATRPANSTTPTWACTYLFVAATIGGTVTAGTWAAPVNAGQNGADGAIGSQTMLAYLYQWGSAAPAVPTGTSTLNWLTGANTSYTGSDGWAVAAPANPGTPGLRLYVAIKPVTAAGGTTSTPAVSYSGATVSAWSQNGANGNPGANGAQSREIKVFQWALTIPAAPSGTGALSWATGLFGGAPANWSLAPGAPVPGFTQWSAKVLVTDTATATSTSFSWSTASIGAETSAGGDGLSYVTAYVATTVGTASTAPAPTTGKTSVPAANSSGLPGTPQSTVPALAAGQYLMQFDGSYNKATDQITWSIPYQSSAKFASLSAITANTGALTVTGLFSSANGNFQVDANGQATMKAVTILNADGTVNFQSGLSLAQQTYAGVNLVPRVSDWPTDQRIAGTTIGVNTADAGAINGEFIVLPAASSNGPITGTLSDKLPIPPGAWYTVSFDARSDDSRSVTIDVFGTNVDTGGAVLALTAATQRQKFTEQMPSNANGDARLRILSGTAGGRALISNIKVELGKVATAWTDDAITASNSAARVGPNAINNSQFGGDLFSTNYVPGSAGWLLNRSGTLYANNVQLRGFLAGGAWTSWASPAAGAGTGFYIGPEGMVTGNYNDGRYVALYQNGDIVAPGFALINKQLTLTNPIIVTPQLTLAAFSVNAGGDFDGGYANGGVRTLFTTTAQVTGGRAPLTYVWSQNADTVGFQILNGTTPTVTVKAGGRDSITSGTIVVTVTDANGAVATDTINAIARFGNPVTEPVG